MCTLSAGLLYNRVYSWRVSSQNDLGFGGWSETFAFKTMIATGLDEQATVPLRNNLQQNYPNPFNPNTTITFSLAQKAVVSITIFDMLGKQVQEIINDHYPAGEHSVSFNASGLSAGIYFYRINALSEKGKVFSRVRKMILIK
jgi:hypothetical protein